MKSFIFCYGLLLLALHLSGQSFHTSGQYMTSADKILADQFHVIYSVDNTTISSRHSFSSDDPSSLLVIVITDDRGSLYHLIIQSAASGGINYIGCSDNLISKKGEKIFQSAYFKNCISSAVKAFASVEREGAVRDCFLQLLNRTGK